MRWPSSLRVGQVITQTYTVTIDDGHTGGTVTQPVTVTITGTEDAPTITSGPQSGAITELPGTHDSTALDTATGAVTFTDVDLIDHHTVSVTGVTVSGATSGLPSNSTLLGWLTLGTLTDTVGGLGGSDAWTFSAQDKNFDYLTEGQTVTLTYTVQVDDGHTGGVVTQPVQIVVTGTSFTSPDPFTLTTGTDHVFYQSGENHVNGTNATLNNGDTLSGGTGEHSNDILHITDGALGPFTFGDGTGGSIGLTNFENLVLTDTNSGNHLRDTRTFFCRASITACSSRSMVRESSATAGWSWMRVPLHPGRSRSPAAQETAATTALTTGGSGDDTINGGAGTGADTITGGRGADTMTGGGGADTFIINSGDSPVTIIGSGNNGTISGYDIITDFSATTDFLDLAGTPVAATGTQVDGANSTLTIGGNTIKSHTITNGIISFDDLDSYASAISLNGISNVAAVVQYLHNNDLGNAGATVAFTATISGVSHTYVYEQVGDLPDSASDILVDLRGVTVTNLSSLIANAHVKPAGIAGEPINLALTDPSTDANDVVTVTVSGLASGWTLNGGTHLDDGSWTVQTADVQSLTVTSPTDFTGALALNVTETWTNADGTAGLKLVSDNAEVFTAGSPIFAWSGDDSLTASAGKDLLVFSQPIGHDTVYSFDAVADQIDLIGYASFTSFADVQAHMTEDAAGNAVITLGDGQSITLQGVDEAALTGINFVFNETPALTNAGLMTINDGAMLPLSGTINNTGTIALSSIGDETDLQLIQTGATLHGGGQIVLSDSDANIISGTSPGVTLDNQDNTISGAGHLGNGELSLTNAGLINATGTHALEIDTGTNTVLNSGTLEASGSGGLTVASSILNSGVLWANGAAITVQGEVSGNGTAAIDGNGVLDFEASSTANVVFNPDAAGTLKLGDSFHFNGTISGFQGSDIIDLADMGSAAASISYHENAAGTGGTLAVSNGAQTVELYSSAGSLHSRQF